MTEKYFNFKSPGAVNNRMKDISKTYGNHIWKTSLHLYLFCWESVNTTSVRKKHSEMFGKNLPFLRKGYRESGMVYLYILRLLMKGKKKDFWDDAIFIIQLTYYTGLSFDHWTYKRNNEVEYIISSNAMRVCMASKKLALASDEFKNYFEFVLDYKFTDSTTVAKRRIKERLDSNRRSFEKKVENNESVSFFLKKMKPILINGL